MNPVAASSRARGERAQTVRIPRVELWADLRIPRAARGLVMFAHGSGSSRLSPRNRAVAEALVSEGFATLLLDLLMPEEEVNRANVFDIELLAARLVQVIDWSRSQPGLATEPLGLFGASTGAAAAIRAAARRPADVRAVVSRGGRPDLAGDALEQLTAPTLLIVGGDDEPVIEINREALGRLVAPARLVIVPGATHLFEEPGAMEQVIELAVGWFGEHLAASPAPTE